MFDLIRRKWNLVRKLWRNHNRCFCTIWRNHTICLSWTWCDHPIKSNNNLSTVHLHNFTGTCIIQILQAPCTLWWTGGTCPSTHWGIAELTFWCLAATSATDVAHDHVDHAGQAPAVRSAKQVAVHVRSGVRWVVGSASAWWRCRAGPQPASSSSVGAPPALSSMVGKKLPRLIFWFMHVTEFELVETCAWPIRICFIFIRLHNPARLRTDPVRQEEIVGHVFFPISFPHVFLCVFLGFFFRFPFLLWCFL